MAIVFKASGMYEVILEGVELLLRYTLDEKLAYNEIKSMAMITFLQLISSSILVQYNRIHNPVDLWKHLRTEYYTDSPFSFIHQLHCLFAMQYDSSKLVSTFIDKFEP